MRNCSHGAHIGPELISSFGFQELFDSPTLLRGCVELCQENGCVGNQCFQSVFRWTVDGGRWYLQEPFYLKYKQWDCNIDCRYHCMLSRKEERRKLGEQPAKYHGRWPFVVFMELRI